MSDASLFVFMIAIVALLMTQAFVSPLMGSSARTRRKLRRRIRDLSADSAPREHVSAVQKKYQASLSPFAQRLESLPGMEGLRSSMDQAGLEFPAHWLALGAAGCAAAAFVVAGAILGWGAAALVSAAIGGLVPFFLVLRRRRQRMAKFEEELPDALGVLSRSLRAGLPFSEGMHIVSQEMEGPVAAEFGVVFTEVNYGGDVRTALLGMLDRMPTIAVMATVTSILIQRETGGNLADILDRISSLIRQRFRFQRSVKTLTAEGRLSAWVVAVMPFALAAVLELANPGWVTTLTGDPLGRQLVIGAFVLMILGILWIRKLVRLDV